MFDIFCVGDNPVKEILPGVKQVNDESDIKSLTKMYWIIEPNVRVTDLEVFDFRPADHDDKYVHVWKWNSDNYGGVRLQPRKTVEGVKEHNRVVCEKSYDVITSDTPEEYFIEHPYATHVWVADPEYILPERITWAPDNFEPGYTHVFHIPGQLEHKYPKQEGGIKLYPRNNPKEADLKYHGYLDVKIDFPVIRTSDPNNYDMPQNIETEYVWVVDKRLQIHDSELQWVPNVFQRDMVHNFHIPGQLEHEYPQEQGPVNLIPVGVTKPEIVYHGELSVRYQVIKVTDPSDFTQRDHVKSEFVWLVDERYSTSSEDLNFIPNLYDRGRVHNFHLKHQLEHIYPENMGGVYLVPRNWQDAELKVMGVIDGVRYPIVYTKYPEAYEQRDYYADDYVWLIDEEYKINPDSLTWTPSVFEDNQIHNFKMPNQLTEKYPQEMGGIYLVPKEYSDSDLKIHKTCPVEDELYEVYEVDHSELTQEKFTELASLSPTEWFWVVDSDYEFNGKLRYVPAEHESQYIQVFKWGLEHRYLPEVTELWDNRVAGIFLCNKNFDWDQKKLHTDIVPIEYDIFYVDDVNDIKNYQKYSRKSRTKAFWLIDAEHRLPDRINWIPPLSEQSFINIFKGPKQLDHKYPIGVTNTSDNRCGGIKLVPIDFDISQVKYQGQMYQIEYQDFERFYSYQEGMSQSKTDWFWVIDSDVTVSEDFDWEFMPDSWDTGKTHVWQVANPVTGLNYDYGGVRLCHKNPVGGRDKYIKKTGSTRCQLDILYLDASKDILEQLNNYHSETYMYYVIDPNVIVSEDFEFDIYPTQWDKDCVHIFKTSDGDYKNVRLVPKGYEFQSLDQITNNSYEKLKEHDIVASIAGAWPYYKLETLDAKEFHNIRQNCKSPWFYTIDPGTDILNDNWSYQPDVNDFDRVHAWQRVNPANQEVHSYGGVRLWPTEYCDNITTDALVFNRIPRLRYVREAKSAYKPMDVLYLSDQTDIVEQLNNYESETYMYYVVDPHVKIHPEFKFDYYPTPWDRELIHLFKNTDGTFKNVRLVPSGFKFESLDQITNNSYDTLKEMDIIASVNREWPVYELSEMTAFEFHAIRVNVTEPWFFTVDPDAEPLTDVWDCEPDVNDFDRVHAWQRLNPHTGQVHGYGGVRLWPTAHCDNITTDGLIYNRIPRLRYVRQPRSQNKPYPVILLSYHEERAQTAFDALSSRSDNVIWVKDVPGIFNAHKEAAKRAGDSKMFWVVDADAELSDDFDFSYIPDVYDQETVHVWTTINPITGSKYGYGGVKLFNTQQVVEATSWGLDFTTGLSKKFKIMPEICGTTKFNTTAYDTWRSAFREVVKLTVSSDPEAENRIREWLNPIPEADYGVLALHGAKLGKAFAEKNRDNPAILEKINDYAWLKKEFEQR